MSTPTIPLEKPVAALADINNKNNGDGNATDSENDEDLVRPATPPPMEASLVPPPPLTGLSHWQAQNRAWLSGAPPTRRAAATRQRPPASSSTIGTSLSALLTPPGSPSVDGTVRQKDDDMEGASELDRSDTEAAAALAVAQSLAASRRAIQPSQYLQVYQKLVRECRVLSEGRGLNLSVALKLVVEGWKDDGTSWPLYCFARTLQCMASSVGLLPRHFKAFPASPPLTPQVLRGVPPPLPPPHPLGGSGASVSTAAAAAAAAASYMSPLPPARSPEDRFSFSSAVQGISTLWSAAMTLATSPSGR
ncbi:hypothetical protein BC828DRAFT_389149 [Blastocladiella britannica]|nr:hypothetical protein BC828DRAFT_389149 [Blastocladiella britannica]